jgi:hypothetical protein
VSASSGFFQLGERLGTTAQIRERNAQSHGVLCRTGVRLEQFVISGGSARPIASIESGCSIGSRLRRQKERKDKEQAKKVLHEIGDNLMMTRNVIARSKTVTRKSRCLPTAAFSVRELITIENGQK